MRRFREITVSDSYIREIYEQTEYNLIAAQTVPMQNNLTTVIDFSVAGRSESGLQ